MAKAKELEPTTPTEEQLRAMRHVLERNLSHNIAWIDGGEAFSCASATLHPNSKAARIVRSGLCLRWDREKVQTTWRDAVGAWSAQGWNQFGGAAVAQQEVRGEFVEAKCDPYAEHTRLERERNYCGLTFDHPDNVRARKVAALREQLSVKVEPRFPSEGRSDRVYAVNQERR